MKEIKYLIKKKQPKVIRLSQTHVADVITHAVLDTNDYNIEKCCANNRSTGVIMYIETISNISIKRVKMIMILYGFI